MDLCHEEERDGWTDFSGGGGECIGTCFPVRATLERKFLIHLALKIFAKILSCAFRICFFYPSVPPVSEFLRCTTIASIRPHLSSPSPSSSFPLDHKIPPFAFEKRNGVGTEKGGGIRLGGLPTFFFWPLYHTADPSVCRSGNALIFCRFYNILPLARFEHIV